jgi:DNA-binding NtrC family response regulator
MATTRYVALLGDFSNESVDLESIGKEFGWRVWPANDLPELKTVRHKGHIVAVIVHPRTLDLHWIIALQAVQDLLPDARILLCHGVRQIDSRSEMIRAGAFDVLLSPLKHTEVRHSLGFVWAAGGPAMLEAVGVG